MDTDQLQRLDQFLSDPQVPQEDKNRAVAMARTQDQNDTPEQRAGSYVTNKADQFASAAQNLFADATGQAQPAGRTWRDTGSDALTVGGPVAMLAGGGAGAASVPVGLGVGAALRAGGQDEETADLGNAATQLVGGLGGAVYKGVSDVGAIKGAIKGQYGAAAAGAAKKGLQLSAKWPVAEDVRNAAQNVLETAGSASVERQVATQMLGRLDPRAILQQAQGGGPSYAELDRAYYALRKIPGASKLRGAINAAMTNMLGDEERAARLGGQEMTRLYTPGKSLMTKPMTPPILGKFLPPAIAKGVSLSPNQLGLLARGAAPGLARTALGVGSMREQAIGDESGPGNSDSDETAPEAPTAPETAPASQPAAQPTQVVQGRYGREIGAVAQLVGIPQELLHVVIHRESNGDPNAVGSDAPSQGLMQILPSTFKSVQGDVEKLIGRQASVMNPLDNMLGGALLLRRYLDKTDGDVETALRMYQGGENRQAWGSHNAWYGRTLTNDLFAGK